MDKKEIIKQTKLAFSHVHKLYTETSFLIKEIEAQLAEEPENFVIGKPSGYSVTSRSSTGLETRFIYYWPIRKFGVFFVPIDMTTVSGTTNTELKADTKVIYVRFSLDDDDIKEPIILFGTFYGFGDNKAKNKKFTKVEQLLAHIEYRDKIILANPNQIEYEDSYVIFKGKLQKVNLFDINGSEEVNKQIVQRALDSFRSIQ